MKTSEWISVKDRLPECDKTPDAYGVQVLIWPHATFSGTADSPTAFFGCRITNKPSFYLYGAVLDEVTHWMPLPELKDPILDTAQVVDISLSSINEILEQGLKYSTWAKEFPEAYKDLLQYKEDMAISVAHTVCDKLDIEKFDWPRR